jgi:Ca-activated chloride channel family protein
MPRPAEPNRRRLRAALPTILSLALAALPAGRASAQAPETSRTSAAPDRPSEAGTGVLFRKTSLGLAPLPMLRMEVDLRVTGIMARGTVSQSFSNGTPEVIEALYVFPLPERAAVDSLEVQIGDRRIRSVVREREAARAVYERARSEGKKAGLLEERPSHLFTTALANVNPGETVVVKLEYVEEVEVREGRHRLAFPLTWTPRFTPRAPAGFAASAAIGPSQASEPGAAGGGGSDADAADDEDGCFVEASHPTAPLARIRARIEAGLPLGPIVSPSHPLSVTRQGGTAWVEAGRGEVVADRDFVLEWEVPGGRETKGAVFVEERDDGRYALVMLVPPADDQAPPLPSSTLFIVDVSSSMDGPSIEQARKALSTALDRLRPDDSFNLLQFNDASTAFREEFQPAVPSRLEEARRWVASLSASGGTEILGALVHGMRLASAESGRRVRRIILITDGAVNGEEEVIREVGRSLGEARLSVIGIGAAPNRRLMRRIARYGRGACDFIASPEEVEDRVDAFLRRIDRPVLADLRLDWDGAPPLDAYPLRLPDVHAGEPLFVSLRLGPSHTGTRARLTGWTSSGQVTTELAVAPGAPRGAGVATRWARARVDDLLDGLLEGADPETVRREVVDVATRFHLVTRFTSLVAVEETPTASSPATPFQVANALPPGAGEDLLPPGATSGPLVRHVALLLVLLGTAVIGLGRFCGS